MNLESTFSKDSFVFYKSFYESIKLLPKKTQLDIYIAICEFSLYGNLIELPPKTMAYLTLIIPQIEANFRRREWGKIGGKIGGRPKQKENQPFDSEKGTFSDSEKDGLEGKKPNANANANANVNVNANANVNVNAPRGGISLDECKRFAQSEGIQCDVEAFWKFYSTPDDQGRTWMDSKGKPVTNWRQKLMTWASLEKAQPKRNAKRDRNTLNNYKVEGKGVANLDDIVFDQDEL